MWSSIQEVAIVEMDFQHHKQGLQVTTKRVRKLAEYTLPYIMDKSIPARSGVVQQSLNHVGLSHYIATHIAKKSNKEMEYVLVQFMAYMRRKVRNMNSNHVIN